MPVNAKELLRLAGGFSPAHKCRMKILALLMISLLPAVTVAQTRLPTDPSEITLSFAPLVRQAAPAVVNIYARRVTEVRDRSPFADDPFFRDFFENFGPSQPQVQNSLGSGVILSEDGLAVSNYHVVGMATEIRVVLNDRREYSADVLLGDQDSDLAVLKLRDASGLPYLPLRDSDTVEVGELVLAIGNPFGVGQTVSSGIVSGLARSGATGNAGRGYFIQTDAPINPGNSGGALVGMGGRLIGINTSILTRSGGSNGIGFAIPADLVAAFLRQAEAGRTAFLRPWAGLSGQSVDRDMAGMLGLDRPGGIILSDIHPASAFATDFTVGDVIVAVDGAPVNTPPEMMYHMAVAGEGARLAVSRLRDGKIEEILVPLIAPPETPPRDTQVLPEGAALPGLTLWQVNPAVLAELDLPNAFDGIVVADPGPVGRRVGLRSRDLLRAVDGTPVASTAEAAQALARARRGTSVVLIRGDRQIALRF